MTHTFRWRGTFGGTSDYSVTVDETDLMNVIVDIEDTRPNAVAPITAARLLSVDMYVLPISGNANGVGLGIPAPTLTWAEGSAVSSSVRPEEKMMVVQSIMKPTHLRLRPRAKSLQGFWFNDSGGGTDIFTIAGTGPGTGLAGCIIVDVKMQFTLNTLQDPGRLIGITSTIPSSGSGFQGLHQRQISGSNITLGVVGNASYAV